MNFKFNRSKSSLKSGRLYVSRTKSNVFLVFTDLNNKPVRVVSSGMAINRSRVTVRDKLLPKTVGVMTRAFAKLILLRKVVSLDVIFEYNTFKYVEIILEKLFDSNISVNAIFWRNGVSFNGCKKRKSRRK